LTAQAVGNSFFNVLDAELVEPLWKISRIVPSYVAYTPEVGLWPVKGGVFWYHLLLRGFTCFLVRF
jgi:hypothetical protein